MAAEIAAEDSDTAPVAPAAMPASEAPGADDLGQRLQQTLERQLDAFRSELQTAVLLDVMTLVAETAAPEQSELQRRAQAIQVELTLRRQEVALAEWRRNLAAAEQEAERRRQLFARLAADFERRLAEFERRSAEFEQAAALARDGAAAQRALEQYAAQAARDLAAAAELEAARRQLIQALEHDLARTRQEKSESDEALARRERVLAEAERRVEELRSSRWRQLGLGLGLTKRATFEG